MALKGVNNSGKLLTVSELLPIPLPSLAVHDAAELYEYNYGEKMQGKPIDMCIAAGPYTLDDDLSYLPLEDLLHTLASEQPDILLLVSILPQPCILFLSCHSKRKRYPFYSLVHLYLDLILYYKMVKLMHLR